MAIEKKNKKGFLDGYKKYDPKVSGYGSPDKWRAAFDERMGYSQARDYLKGKNEDEIPFAAEMKAAKTAAELQSIYRKAMLKNHPDHGGKTDVAQAIVALNAVLKKKFDSAET